MIIHIAPPTTGREIGANHKEIQLGIPYTLKSVALCVIYYIKIGRSLHLPRYVLGYMWTLSVVFFGNII